MISEKGRERTGRERNISSDIGLPEQKDSDPDRVQRRRLGVNTLESTCTEYASPDQKGIR